MQDRNTYAKGSTLESTTGYVVKVGMPVVDDTVKATSNGATFTEKAPLTDGQYLVTLEVNGEAVAYKESVTADSGITVGDYSVAEDAGKVVLTGASANDIVRLLIEPLDVFVSDGFRAAINKAVPLSGGGSGGGIPTPTADDVGKVLMVVAQYTKGESVASQETYEFYPNHDIFEFANSDYEGLMSAEAVIVTINGTDYSASVENGVASVSAGNDTYIIRADWKAEVVKCQLSTLNVGEYKTSTIAVYLATSECEWAAVRVSE